jgi:hypothetical protein
MRRGVPYAHLNAMSARQAVNIKSVTKTQKEILVMHNKVRLLPLCIKINVGKATFTGIAATNN